MYTEQECGDSKPERHSSPTARDIFDLIIEDSAEDMVTNEAKYIYNLQGERERGREGGREGVREGGRERREIRKSELPPISV